MGRSMGYSKTEIAQFVNKNCVRSSCLFCKTADTHGGYEHCPFLELKQLAFDRKVLSSDVPDDLTSK